MRRLWMVVGCALSSIYISGCEAQTQINADSKKPLTGCVFRSQKESQKIIEKSKDFFLREVGTKIASMELEAPSYCASRIVVPIVATTQNTSVSRVWFVEIETSGPEQIRLIRPE